MTVTAVKPIQVTVRSPVRFCITAGQQGPRGVAGPAGSALTAASWTTSGTAGARTNNAILANDVVLAMPASPADRDAIEVFVPQAYTGIELDGNGATIDAAASITLPLTPCSLKLVYLEAEDNWFIFSMYTGQNAA